MNICARLIETRSRLAARKKENAENWLTRDPEIKCYLPGVPRATYLPYPFQILESTNKILIAYEFAGATRTIHMDDVGSSPADTWMGWSRGHWEGDTLVVDVTSFNDQTWFDRAGNFHSEALHVVERYTRIDYNTINYEATLEDPKALTRPWTIQSKIIAIAFSMAAEIERDLISQRTKEALRFKKSQGMVLGRPPGPGKSKLDPYRPEIEGLLANGSTQKFVAGRYRTTEANLHNWLKKRGLK